MRRSSARVGTTEAVKRDGGGAAEVRLGLEQEGLSRVEQ